MKMFWFPVGGSLAVAESHLPPVYLLAHARKRAGRHEVVSLGPPFSSGHPGPRCCESLATGLHRDRGAGLACGTGDRPVKELFLARAEERRPHLFVAPLRHDGCQKG